MGIKHLLVEPRIIEKHLRQKKIQCMCDKKAYKKPAECGDQKGGGRPFKAGRLLFYCKTGGPAGEVKQAEKKGT